ncbi:MAG TPA: hypothetical protein VK358_09320 [Longimicrobium sp.]|nr:hypothetical protein [Longimicrobium sp.]
MPASKFYAFGTQEIGFVTGGNTLTPVTETTKDGVDIQLTAQFVDLYGGKDMLPADSKAERGELTLAATMKDASLTALKFALALPDAALTGDLSAATPTAEVLAIDASTIGSVRRHIYALGPGPSTTRKIEIPNAQWQGIGGLGQKGNAHTNPQPTFRALTPASGPAVRITDAV